MAVTQLCHLSEKVIIAVRRYYSGRWTAGVVIVVFYRFCWQLASQCCICALYAQENSHVGPLTVPKKRHKNLINYCKFIYYCCTINLYIYIYIDIMLDIFYLRNFFINPINNIVKTVIHEVAYGESKKLVWY